MAIQSNFPAIRPSLLLDFANSKRLDPRITFTRASTARFYDGSTVAKAEENLLLQSQDFTTSWTADDVTVTANTIAAPDGTTTADTVADTATNSDHRAISSAISITSGLAYTFSVFVKDVDRNFVQLAFPSAQFGATAYANFDVSTGVTGTVGAGTTASIVNVGGGWYRCIITATASGGVASTSVFVGLLTSSTSARAEAYAGTGLSVYLWGGQLEQRSAVTAYTATTTAPVTNYVPVLQTAASGVPRFDHNPTTGESLGLLIEEARTNIATYSDDFANAAWTKTRASISSNVIIAPDGTLTGDKLIEDTTASNNHLASWQTTLTANTTYTMSVYAKAAERNFIALQTSSVANWSVQTASYFNLTTGVVTGGGGTTGTMTNVGNGWWRCSITATFGGSNATGGMNVLLADSTPTFTYTGNGISGAYIWGAQLEAGAFATSYIPTVAASATRQADAASMTGTNFSSWYDAAEGTMYGDYNSGTSASDADGAGGGRGVACISDNTTSNRIRFASSLTTLQAWTGGTQQAGITVGTRAAFTNYRAAGCYKVNDFSFARDGVLGTPDTSGTVPLGVNRLDIGYATPGGGILNGTIKKFAFYPLRVTDAQLTALTG